jgi:hypothetical protein
MFYFRFDQFLRVQNFTLNEIYDINFVTMLNCINAVTMTVPARTNHDVDGGDICWKSSVSKLD